LVFLEPAGGSLSPNGTIVHLRKSIKNNILPKDFQSKVFLFLIVIDFIDYICIIKIFMSYTLSSPYRVSQISDLEMQTKQNFGIDTFMHLIFD
jgi:hypothetical protein